ncbi:hypothetical protein [Polycyclovorans algicola]|uniref:hypothetical protein n=1 Tax=Polycyclovorans algicola TaxID=616992 RepID=UPI0004A6E5F5|nr:hypothetical protein [Polycyclovorans algicola]
MIVINRKSFSTRLRSALAALSVLTLGALLAGCSGDDSGSSNGSLDVDYEARSLAGPALYFGEVLPVLMGVLYHADLVNTIGDAPIACSLGGSFRALLVSETTNRPSFSVSFNQCIEAVGVIDGSLSFTRQLNGVTDNIGASPCGGLSGPLSINGNRYELDITTCQTTRMANGDLFLVARGGIDSHQVLIDGNSGIVALNTELLWRESAQELVVSPSRVTFRDILSRDRNVQLDVSSLRSPGSRTPAAISVDAPTSGALTYARSIDGSQNDVIGQGNIVSGLLNLSLETFDSPDQTLAGTAGQYVWDELLEEPVVEFLNRATPNE